MQCFKQIWGEGYNKVQESIIILYLRNIIPNYHLLLEVNLKTPLRWLRFSPWKWKKTY